MLLKPARPWGQVSQVPAGAACRGDVAFACPSLRSRLASSGTDYPSDDLRGGVRCPARLKNRVSYGIDVHPPVAQPREGVPLNSSVESRVEQYRLARGGTDGSPS